VGEGWERGGRRLLRGKQNEIEREGAPWARVPGWAGLGHRPGRKPTTHTTTNRNLIVN
jgi:hypothetical protein